MCVPQISTTCFQPLCVFQHARFYCVVFLYSKLNFGTILRGDYVKLNLTINCTLCYLFDNKIVLSYLVYINCSSNITHMLYIPPLLYWPWFELH